MENYIINRDIQLFYVTAASFPDGVGAAFEQMLGILPNPNNRILYGISWPNEKGDIVYKVAVEELFEGEGKQNGCETFLIKKGIYWSEFLNDWRKDKTIIGKTFQKLLTNPNLDKQGYCLEIYTYENDVYCLVPLTE